MADELRFHRNVASLLREMPPVSRASVELIAQSEEQLGIRFPKSVREWYSLDGAVNILERHSNCDSPVGIRDLGKPFDDWYGGGPRDFVSEKLLVFMHENQGVCNWVIVLDGSSDPPIVVEVDTAPNDKWLPCSEHFSTFVWCQIWDHTSHSFGVMAQETELADVDIEYLASCFPRNPTTFGWPGKTNYRFGAQDSGILIWDGEDSGVDWHLSARTSHGLSKLIEKVWHCGELATTLYGDGESAEVLRAVRSEMMK
jgi:hypothetical protein